MPKYVNDILDFIFEGISWQYPLEIESKTGMRSRSQQLYGNS
jgi:hypothetical protein